MSSLTDILNNFQERFFRHIVSGRLVYNACWEDPRIDRKLLNIKPGSEIVMLTSAGCNALEYLLDYPEIIHCVDRNPAQNALLELKKAFFKHRDYDLLWQYFGEGHHPDAAITYRRHIAHLLPEKFRPYWDRNINCFSRPADISSFYFTGTAGKVAGLFQNYIHKKGLYEKIQKLIDARSLAEQRYYFEDIDPVNWNHFYQWMLSRDTTMALLGVPRNQRKMIDEQFDGGLLSFIHSSIEHVFTRLPVHDNYFWRVYLTGSYTRRCRPSYLEKDYFPFLSSEIDKITTYTLSLSDFLEQHPGSYSHFVLLDHQDWMADKYPDKLASEWKLIFRNARPGARVLFRSAGKNRHFLPDFVHNTVSFKDRQARDLHQNDRVGTYGSTHLAVIPS